jgi:dihydrolipoamide dehydrogenase
VSAGKTKLGLKRVRRYNVGQFSFFANSWATTNLDSDGQVKFLVEETNRILGLHIVGASHYCSFVWRLLPPALVRSYFILS